MSRTVHVPATHGNGVQVTAGPFDAHEDIAIHDHRGVIGYYSARAGRRFVAVLVSALDEAERKRGLRRKSQNADSPR